MGANIFLLLLVALPTFFLIRSDLKLDQERPVTVLNWLGTNFMLFSGIGLIYFFVVIFFMKKIHPSKSNYLKAVLVPAIIFIGAIIFMIATGNMGGAEQVQ